MNRLSLLIILLPVNLVCGFAQAETIYIDDKVLAGIHQEKSTDSVILKVIPSGTALQVIKQDKPLTQVKSPDGTTGWIDNKYLVKTAPGRAQLTIAEEKIAQLENELSTLKSSTGNRQNNPDLTRENEELKQLLKSERLRVGELQAQTAELKNKLGQENTNEDVTSQLEKLSREKAELQQQLSNLQTATNSEKENINVEIGEFNWKKMLITIAVSLVLGIIIGVYLLDLMIRRRHGGFRV